MIKLPSIHGEYTGEAKGEKFGKDSLNENIEDLTGEIKILNTNIKKTKGSSFGGMTSGSGSGSGLEFLSNPLVLTGIATGISGLLLKKLDPKFNAIEGAINIYGDALRELKWYNNIFKKPFGSSDDPPQDQSKPTEKKPVEDDEVEHWTITKLIGGLGAGILGGGALWGFGKRIGQTVGKQTRNKAWNMTKNLGKHAWRNRGWRPGIPGRSINPWVFGLSLLDEPFNELVGARRDEHEYFGDPEKLNDLYGNAGDTFHKVFDPVFPWPRLWGAHNTKQTNIPDFKGWAEPLAQSVNYGMTGSARSTIQPTPLSNVAEHDVINKLMEKISDAKGSSYNKDLGTSTVEDLIKMNRIKIGEFGMSSDLLKEYSDKGVIDKSTKFTIANQEKILESILRAIIDGNSSYIKSASEISDKILNLKEGKYDTKLTEREIFEILKKWENADSKTEELEKAEREKKEKDTKNKNVEATTGNVAVSQPVINNNNVTNVHPPPRPGIEDESFHRYTSLMTGSYNSFATG